MSFDTYTRMNLNKHSVTIMPDFFIDRIVKVPSLELLMTGVKTKLMSGGGSIRGFEQVDLKGGNATNVAYAIGKMGVSVNLIVIADRQSEMSIRHKFSNLPNVDIDVLRGKPGHTVALEFQSDGTLSNVMLSDVGDVIDAGPDKISKSTLYKKSKTDLVGVFNWAANTRGTELAEAILSRSCREGCLTYFAPADLASRRDEVSELFSKLIGVLGVLSVNENETRVISDVLLGATFPSIYAPVDICRAAEALSNKLGCRVDVHTPLGCASAFKKSSIFMESFSVVQKVSTGAGDVWDAANIAGYLLRIDDINRLKFANAAAALYVSSTEFEPPSLEQVISFLKDV